MCRTLSRTIQKHGRTLTHPPRTCKPCTKSLGWIRVLKISPVTHWHCTVMIRILTNRPSKRSIALSCTQIRWHVTASRRICTRCTVWENCLRALPGYRPYTAVRTCWTSRSMRLCTTQAERWSAYVPAKRWPNANRCTAIPPTYRTRYASRARLFVAFACWIIRSQIRRMPFRPRLSFHRCKSTASPTFTYRSLARHIKYRRRVGSLPWYPPRSRPAIPRRRLSLVSICWDRSHKSSCPSRTTTNRPTTVCSRRCSSRSRTMQPHTSRPPVWMCSTFSSAALARTLTFPKSNRNSVTRSS
uniref:Uncharacterized protein n=1 Tax=Anopheles maculatus TaxID=74869 RepID=A0A182T281_9DIPT